MLKRHKGKKRLKSTENIGNPMYILGKGETFLNNMEDLRIHMYILVHT